MDYASRLRQHTGETSILVEQMTYSHHPVHILDFSKTMHGEEVIIIEVGEQSVIIEYLKTGHWEALPFNEIQVKEDPSYIM